MSGSAVANCIERTTWAQAINADIFLARQVSLHQGSCSTWSPESATVEKTRCVVNLVETNRNTLHIMALGPSRWLFKTRASLGLRRGSSSLRAGEGQRGGSLPTGWAGWLPAPAPSAAPVPVRLCAPVSVWREEAWVTGQGLGEELGSPSRSLTPRFLGGRTETASAGGWPICKAPPLSYCGCSSPNPADWSSPSLVSCEGW